MNMTKTNPNALIGLGIVGAIAAAIYFWKKGSGDKVEDRQAGQTERTSLRTDRVEIRQENRTERWGNTLETVKNIFSGDKSNSGSGKNVNVKYKITSGDNQKVVDSVKKNLSTGSSYRMDNPVDIAINTFRYGLPTSQVTTVPAFKRYKISTPIKNVSEKTTAGKVIDVIKRVAGQGVVGNIFKKR